MQSAQRCAAHDKSGRRTDGAWRAGKVCAVCPAPHAPWPRCWRRALRLAIGPNAGCCVAATPLRRGVSASAVPLQRLCRRRAGAPPHSPTGYRSTAPWTSRIRFLVCAVELELSVSPPVSWPICCEGSETGLAVCRPPSASRCGIVVIPQLVSASVGPRVLPLPCRVRAFSRRHGETVLAGCCARVIYSAGRC